MDPNVIHGLVKEAAVTIREQEMELATLRQKVAAYEAQERAEMLVERMEARGLGDSIEGRTTKEKAASLLSTGKSLDVLEEAISWQSGQGGRQFALDGSSKSGGSTPFNAIELALLERHGTR